MIAQYVVCVNSSIFFLEVGQLILYKLVIIEFVDFRFLRGGAILAVSNGRRHMV